MLILNVVVLAVTLAGIAIIGEDVSAKTLALLLTAYFVMQLETAAVTFGISAFLKRGSTGIGLGLAAMFYFLNIAANLTEKAEFLKYLTPFGYTDSADIIANGAISTPHLIVGIIFAFAGIIIGFYRYTKKDIA